MCCSGQKQTKNFNVTLFWRIEPDIERRLKFSASGKNGKWSGNGSGQYNLGDPIYKCGVRSLKGIIVLRTKITLECMETDRQYVGGILQFTLGKSTHRGQLKPVELICDAPNSSAEWPQLWLGPLGSATLQITGL